MSSLLVLTNQIARAVLSIFVRVTGYEGALAQETATFIWRWSQKVSRTAYGVSTLLAFSLIESGLQFDLSWMRRNAGHLLVRRIKILYDKVRMSLGLICVEYY